MEQIDALVRRLRAGIELEESARRLDRLLRPRLGRYFAARGFPAGEIDDLVQQTLARVFQGVGGLEAEAAFLGWLFVVARNVGRSVLRARATERAVVVHGIEVGGEAGPPVQVAAENPQARLRLAEVARAIAGLPDQQRRCLILVARDGLAYAEIGQLLGLSPLTVRNHLAEARRRLRRALGERRPREVAE